MKRRTPFLLFIIIALLFIASHSAGDTKGKPAPRTGRVQNVTMLCNRCSCCSNMSQCATACKRMKDPPTALLSKLSECETRYMDDQRSRKANCAPIADAAKDLDDLCIEGCNVQDALRRSHLKLQTAPDDPLEEHILVPNGKKP